VIFFFYSEIWLPNISFKYLRTGQIQNFELFLNSVTRKMTFSINLFAEIRLIYLPWWCSVVTATLDSSIPWMCSHRDLLAMGPNGRTGRPCAALRILQACHRYSKIRLWYTELHCTCILQGMCGRSARITTLRTDILFAGAMSINQWLTIEFATFLKLMKHDTWQPLLNRKRDILTFRHRASST
jgi:hypothetical protein